MTFEGCRVGKFLVVVIELVSLNCVECEESVDQLEETGDWKLRWEKQKFKVRSEKTFCSLLLNSNFQALFESKVNLEYPIWTCKLELSRSHQHDNWRIILIFGQRLFLCLSCI